MQKNDRTRIVLALTETAPIDALWQVLSRWASSPGTEVVAVFVADDRWHRAASLPFTEEISRVGGSSTVFTPQRAEHVHRSAIERARDLIEQLASSTDRTVEFRVLSADEDQSVYDIVNEHTEVIIAHSLIKREPVYAELTRLKCRIELVEDPED